MFKELLGESFSVVEKVAPTLASMVGSPAAGMGTMAALNLLAHAFNVPVNNLGSAIATDSSSTDRLAQLETTFGPWLKNMGSMGGLGFPWPSSVEIKVSWDKDQKGLSESGSPASTP